MKGEITMNIYYFYRMTDDTGNAPCMFELNYTPTPNLLTLACCKSKMRNTIGKIITNKNTSDNIFVIGALKGRIIFVAKINEAILMIDYFSNEKYRKRMDCIYEVIKNSNGDSIVIRRKNYNLSFHGEKEPEAHKNDLNGRYVLLSNDFVYYGKEEKAFFNDVEDLFPKYQGHRRYPKMGQEADAVIQERIEHFISNCFATKCKLFEPTERLTKNNCHTKGCQK